MYIGLRTKHDLFLTKLEFTRRIFEKYFMKIRHVRAGRTDRHDGLLVAFGNFANAPDKRPLKETL